MYLETLVFIWQVHTAVVVTTSI